MRTAVVAIGGWHLQAEEHRGWPEARRDPVNGFSLQAPETTSPTDPLISDFWPPAL